MALPNTTQSTGDAPDEEPARRAGVRRRLREKRAETSERVHAEAARAREAVVENAPTVQKALQERPAAVAGGVLAALLLLGLRTLLARRRTSRGKDAGATG